ncbi:MAG: hypothetical protein ACK5QX_06370 [bacterium]
MTDIPDEIMQRARERADWLVDAIATCLQDIRFIRGDPEEDKALTEAVFINGQKAIAVALMRHETRAIMEARSEGYAVAREQAAKVAETFTNGQHIVHDMRTGVFPEQSRSGVAIAATIRAMEMSDETHN